MRLLPGHYLDQDILQASLYVWYLLVVQRLCTRLPGCLLYKECPGVYLIAFKSLFRVPLIVTVNAHECTTSHTSRITISNILSLKL